MIEKNRFVFCLSSGIGKRFLDEGIYKPKYLLNQVKRKVFLTKPKNLALKHNTKLFLL